MLQPRLVLWDWDNTLVDGWAAIEAGLNAAFAAFGLPLWSRAEVLGNVRRALRESFPEIFGAEWERARDIFYAEVRKQHLQVLTPMPASATALAAVAASGLKQGVISNKQGPLLRAEVAHLGWGKHFGALIGAGDAAAEARSCPFPYGPGRTWRCTGGGCLVCRRYRPRYAGCPRGRVPACPAGRCGP